MPENERNTQRYIERKSHRNRGQECPGNNAEAEAGGVCKRLSAHAQGKDQACRVHSLICLATQTSEKNWVEWQQPKTLSKRSVQKSVQDYHFAIAIVPIGFVSARPVLKTSTSTLNIFMSSMAMPRKGCLQFYIFQIETKKLKSLVPRFCENARAKNWLLVSHFWVRLKLWGWGSLTLFQIYSGTLNRYTKRRYRILRPLSPLAGWANLQFTGFPANFSNGCQAAGWKTHRSFTHAYIHTYLHTYLLAYILTCIHTYLHTYIYTWIHTYVHTHIHMRTYLLTETIQHTYRHAQTHTDTHARTHTHTDIHRHTSMYTYRFNLVHSILHTHIHLQISTHMHTCMHTYIHTSTYLHIHIFRTYTTIT